MEARLTSLDGFRRAPHTRGRGSVAEGAAVGWLKRQGYEIVGTNYRSRAGEIDVVAKDGETLAFVEVKARSGDEYGPAVAAVAPRKQRKIVRAAGAFLAESGWEGPCRFDVLGIDRVEEEWRFTLLRDAFWA